MTAPAPTLAGGCQCGKVRFAIAPADVLATGYCHCSICRRLSGSPVNAWVAVATESLALTSAVARYRSSPNGERGFCAACGTQLFYAPDDNSYITLNATGFDTPEAEVLQPSVHIYTADRLPWFETTDALPRLPGGPASQNETISG